MHRSTPAQIHRHADVQRHRYTDKHIRRDADIQLHRNFGTQGYSDSRTFELHRVRIYEYMRCANMLICKGTCACKHRRMDAHCFPVIVAGGSACLHVMAVFFVANHVRVLKNRIANQQWCLDRCFIQHSRSLAGSNMRTKASESVARKFNFGR